MGDASAAMTPLLSSVLHPTDFSRASHRAFAHALAMALVWQTEFTILHIGPRKDTHVKPSRFPPVRETLERWRLLQPGSPRSAVFDEFRINVTKIAVQSRHPFLALADFIERHPTSLIVLATQRRKWLSRWMNRSDTESLARWSNTKTLFVPAGAKRYFVSLDGEVNLQHILVPVDRDPDCREAVEYSRRIAEIFGDTRVAITLLHVGNSRMPMPTLPEGEQWTWHLESRRGNPATEILAAADRHAADLIVMPTTGRDGMLDAFRGGTAEHVLRRAPCPLLAIPIP